MPNIDMYLVFENLPLNGGFALTNNQRNTLAVWVQTLGQGYMYPAPIRVDNQAGVYEAKFRSDDILQYGWRKQLGSLFSVDPLTINMYEVQTSYSLGGLSTELTFSRNGIDYFKVILFGATSASALPRDKRLSAKECSAYLATYAGLWP